MDFPIIDLLDTQRSLDWLEQHFHPQGMGCAQCGASRDEGRLFRINRSSQLPVYRCRRCDGIYNIYTQTLFAGSQLTAPQVVLLLQGILQGKTSRQLSRELGLTEVTVLMWRHRVQAQAEDLQPESALLDLNTESDEMFQNAGEKRHRTFRPCRPAAQACQ
jgi:transposase-like protein